MTEQEQIEELTQFMLEASDSANVEPVFECENGEDIRLNSGATSILNAILEQAFIPYLAQKLVKAGYGDVSEYKAEIDRLKSENEILKAKLKVRLTCDFIKTAQKHAVQDFAEKLKKYSYTDNCFTDGKWHRYVLVSDIDELLEEAQNAEDKS